MAIKNSRRKAGKVEINLRGPDGNAFVLMAYAKQYSKQLGKDFTPILERMKSGDYENLIAVFDEEFGDYVDLIR